MSVRFELTSIEIPQPFYEGMVDMKESENTLTICQLGILVEYTSGRVGEMHARQFGLKIVCSQMPEAAT